MTRLASGEMMRRLFALVMLALLACIAHAAPQAATAADYQAGKVRLIQALDKNLLDRQKQIDELRVYIKKYGKSPPPDEDRQAMRFSIDPQHLLEDAVRHQQEQRVFLELVKQEDAARLPALLKTIFLSCDQGACQHQLDYSTTEDLIAAYGNLALQPLLDGFKSLDAPRRESVLNLLLRIEPLQCPVSNLDRALLDPVFRVRAASLNVYKKNCSSEVFNQRLAQLLAKETEPDFLLYLLDQLPDEGVQNTQVYNRLIRLTQEKRIPADKALTKLCAASMRVAKLDAPALRLPFWLGVFDTQKSRQACLIENLFLKFDQEQHLLQLHELFRSAAEHRYHFSATQGLYGLKPSGQGSYWDAIPGADEAMLGLFQTHVSPASLGVWSKLPDATLGEKLLLTRWIGGDVRAMLPAMMQLQLEVRSPSGSVVSTGNQRVSLGQPFQFTLPPLVPDFQEVRYQGAVVFDPDQLAFRIKPLIVGLKPAGAGFEAVVPANGAFETDLLLQQQKYRWRIRLTPASY